MAHLNEALDWLNQCFPQFPSSCGTLPDGALNLVELCHQVDSPLTELLSWQAERVPGMDLRTQAAFLIANLSYRLSLLVGSLVLRAGIVPCLSSNRIGLALSSTPALQDDPAGRSRLHLHLCTEEAFESPASSEEQTPELLSVQLEDSFEPLVERLAEDTRLARAAQWRLIADSLAMAFLSVGQALGDETRAKTQALAILKRQGSRLNNKQLAFATLTLPDGENGNNQVKSFVSRGGCCRYYTAPNGQICPTCVLEPLEMQRTRIRDLLLETATES
ncbi:(2Fe-2S)-binding protein [Fodinicurvata sediminis]|uniref:(2Fe-2S)-binding protein n=1 Tax=Fodinicurvata sediminis TaxID=1121832 RepID=UPI0003B79C1D|nr:(2Fe-2S)-binding protein [Fodinicurvata sediminis]